MVGDEISTRTAVRVGLTALFLWREAQQFQRSTDESERHAGGKLHAYSNGEVQLSDTIHAAQADGAMK